MNYIEDYIGDGGVIRQTSQQQLRAQNMKLMFNLINDGKCATRAGLSRKCRLSPSTVSSLVEDLKRAGLVLELGLDRSTVNGGRRAMKLKINAESRQIPVFVLSELGVSYTLYDLGYNVLEHIFWPRLTETGDSEYRDAGSAYAGIICDLLTAKSRRFDPRLAVAALISLPGTYRKKDKRFYLSAMRVTFEIGPLAALRERLSIPIFIGNSSLSLAYAEKKSLEASRRWCQDLLYINICGGVGAGILMGDDVLTQPGRISGEIGHMIIVPNGRPCLCGNRGCLEQYASIGSIISDVRSALAADHSGEHPELVRALLANTTLENIGRAGAQGLSSVSAVLDTVAERLFAGIYGVVNVTGVHHVSLGGIAPLGQRFLERIRKNCSGNSGFFLMDDVTVSFARATGEDEALGIAKYYVDKVFAVEV